LPVVLVISWQMCHLSGACTLSGARLSFRRVALWPCNRVAQSIDPNAGRKLTAAIAIDGVLGLAFCVCVRVVCAKMVSTPWSSPSCGGSSRTCETHVAWRPSWSDEELLLRGASVEQQPRLARCAAGGLDLDVQCQHVPGAVVGVLDLGWSTHTYYSSVVNSTYRYTCILCS
jgi:hypothetical protein